jgi:hypothetical protein
VEPFTAYVARAINQSIDRVEQLVKIGQTFEPYIDRLYGTPNEDTFTELLALSRCSKDKLPRLVELISSGSVSKVSDAKKAIAVANTASRPMSVAVAAQTGASSPNKEAGDIRKEGEDVGAINRTKDRRKDVEVVSSSQTQASANEVASRTVLLQPDLFTSSSVSKQSNPGGGGVSTSSGSKTSITVTGSRREILELTQGLNVLVSAFRWGKAVELKVVEPESSKRSEVDDTPG